MLGEKGEVVAPAGEAPTGGHCAGPFDLTDPREDPAAGGVNGLVHVLPGTKRKPEDHCVSTVGRWRAPKTPGSKPLPGARGWMPAQGHVPEASRTGLPASGAAKPGVWPAGALRSGSQVGVTGQCLGAHQPPPTSLLLLETPASWLEFRAGFTAHTGGRLCLPCSYLPWN